MSESMDVKRFVLVSKKRIWIVPAAAIAFAALTAVVYLLFTYVLAGAFPYRCSALYYIDFDQRTAKETQLYYNDYTWNDVLDSDMIAGRASSICGVSKEDIAAATSIPTSSDIRMIRVYVDMADAKTAENVQSAIGAALADFATEAEGFEGITRWDHEDVQVLKPENHCKRWALFGAVIGAVAAILMLLYESAMDDSVYIESDVKKLCGHTAAAVFFKDGSEDKDKIRKVFETLLKDSESIAVCCFEDENEEAASKVKELIPAGLQINEDAETQLLTVSWGANGRRLKQYADEQELAGKKTVIVITDADRKFFRKYYEV